MTMRIVPDLGEELLTILFRTEQLLTALAAAEEADPGLRLPAPLADRVALGALRRLREPLIPTQGPHARERGWTGRLIAPGGRTAHDLVLRIVRINLADAHTLTAAARALGAPFAEDTVTRAVEAVAGVSGTLVGGGCRNLAQRFVRRISALAGLLNLHVTPETVLLAECLSKADPAMDLVFDGAEETAYQALVRRIVALWGGDGYGNAPQDSLS
jgi:hypothetical protein